MFHVQKVKNGAWIHEFLMTTEDATERSTLRDVSNEKGEAGGLNSTEKPQELR